MSLKALWKPIAIHEAACEDAQPRRPQLARSSHGLVSIARDRVLIFGGELEPRTPVDSDLIEIRGVNDDDDASITPRLATLASSNEGDETWPSARVGASLVTADEGRGKVYLWGGRGGKEMGTFAGETGIWQFDAVGTKQWVELATTGDRPDPRSFHTMCTLNNTLFLHAGCPASGRLGQLHALDLDTRVWTRLPDAPGLARGGTVLTPLPARSRGRGHVLARFGGFAGHELDGLDVYDVDHQEWRSIETEGPVKPEKRSVHVFVGLDGALGFEGKDVVGVLALGEREGAPAELGHNGAGFFHDDAWALLRTREEADAKYSWVKLEPSEKSEGTPEARGWLPAAHLSGSKVVFQGGLNEKNERLGDAWTLKVVVE